MTKKRNGLFEVYRLILSFMPLYYHEFFFIERNYEIFEIPEMVIDFFFMISGFFLMSSMRKLKEEKLFTGMGKIMFGRVKPMIVTLALITVFDLISMIFFIKGEYIDILFELFKYWWYVLYLVVGIGLLYLVYRVLKSEKLFCIFLVLLAIGMAHLNYSVIYLEKLDIVWVFVSRAFGGLSAGILVSYIPKINFKKFNPSFLFVIVLVPALLYLQYNDKTFLISAVMIAMFAALMYFSSHISIGGAVFDFIGMLSVRMYLYMAFLTALRYFGITENKMLFSIDIAVSLIDTTITYCVLKLKKTKKA